MKRVIVMICMVITILLSGCTIAEKATSTTSNPEENTGDSVLAQWAKTVTEGYDNIAYSNVAIDSSGDAYAVGYMACNDCSDDFGDGVTMQGVSDEYNPLLVKYSKSGKTQWIQTETGSSTANYLNITVSSSDDVYIVGFIAGTSTYDFGNGVTVTNTTGGTHPLLVKYTSSGAAQWAKTSATSGTCTYNAIAIDTAGNIYVAGYMVYDNTYNFGDGVTATGNSTWNNPVLVKYNSSGTALWAKTITEGEYTAAYSSIAIDSADNIYVAGYMEDDNTYNFGDGVTAKGSSVKDNLVLVKYNSSGTALWAKTITEGEDNAIYTGITIDNSDNIYVTGYMEDDDIYGFGNGITAAGSSDDDNPLLIKYNSSGEAQWIKTITGGNSDARYLGVITDNANMIYIAGTLGSYDTYDFGNEVTAAGTGDNYSPLVVTYIEQ